MDQQCCFLTEFLQQVAEPSHIRFIQSRIDLIHHAERRRTDPQQGEDQRNRGQAALSAGKQREFLFPVARQLCLDLSAWFRVDCNLDLSSSAMT